MAKVELIEFTGKGRPDENWHAADILIFTKQTRLEMSPSLFEDVEGWSEETKTKELAYMAGTIPSSWEFVDLTFLISGVSRAAAQQITRTRTASYAMQSQRVTDVSSANVVNPHPAGSVLWKEFDVLAFMALNNYKRHHEGGSPLQDARGLLPMNVECNLVAKYNLRSLVDLCRARASLRAQGEYSDIADQMKAAVLEVWPWAEPFFAHPLDSAIAMLEEAAQETGIETGKGTGWKIAKAIDLLRKS